MANWTRIGMDVVVGGAGGAVSKMAEDWDAGRTPTPGTWGKASTWIDYGVPILGIIASALGFLRGDMETRVITMGSTLAGRRVYTQIKAPKTFGGGGWHSIGGGGPMMLPTFSMPAGGGSMSGGARAWVPAPLKT